MSFRYIEDVKNGEIVDIKRCLLKASDSFGYNIDNEKNILESYNKKLKRLTDKFNFLSNATDDELFEKIENDYNQSLKERTEYYEKQVKCKKNICNMMNKLDEWVAPNQELQELKVFIKKNLNIELTKINKILPCFKVTPNKLTVEEYRMREMNILADRINRAIQFIKSISNEIERENKKRKMIEEL